MFRSVIFILVVTSFLSSIASGQVIELEWEKSYGGYEYDAAYSSVLANSTDIIFAGVSYSSGGDVNFPIGSGDVWLCNVDFLGNINWERSFGGSNIEQALKIISTDDGSFVIGGYTGSNDVDITLNKGDADCWVFKIDSLGNMLWQTTIGGSKTDYIYDLAQTADSGFVFTGRSQSNDGDITGHIGSESYTDLIIGKLDADGNLLWVNGYGDFMDDIGYGIAVMSTGELLIGGSKSVDGAFNYDFRVIKTDADGNLIWEKMYGGSEIDEAYDIFVTPSNHIFVCGTTLSSDGDVSEHYPGYQQDLWIIKLDADGNLIWEENYGGSGAEYAYDFQMVTDNDILIAGTSGSPNNGDVTGHHGGLFYGDFWALNIDSLGVIKWANCYGGTEADIAHTLVVDSVGSYLMAGRSKSNDGDVSEHYEGAIAADDFWVIKIKETCTPLAYYADEDEDTYGNNFNYIYSCFDTLGYVLMSGDCDDNNPAIYSGAIETLNGLDDDCDGVADDGVVIREIENSFSVYPNPVLSSLIIENYSGLEITYIISNMTGQNLITFKSHATIATLDLSNFDSGIYLLRMQSATNSFAKQILKQ